MKTRPVLTIGDVIEDIKYAANIAHDLMKYWGTLEDVSVLVKATHSEIYNQPYTLPYVANMFWEGCRVGLFQNFPPHKADQYRAFIDQCHVMYLEAWSREIEKGYAQDVEMWAGYWRLMAKKCGGWPEAKTAMKERFKGLENEYGQILNESYKKAKQ